MRTAMRRVVAIGLAAVAVGCLSAPIHAQPAGASCRDVNIPVGLLGLQTMHGVLCQPAVATRTVAVLVPGGTYASGYWDLPASQGLHSFRGGLNSAGYATLAVDRLGTGRSSRPLSVTLTTLGQAAAIHEVIQRLRAGSLGARFDKVIIGGHSLGAALSVIEAATYHDVDGVLLAGMTHHVDLVDTLTKGFLQFYPATLDPQLIGRLLDPGYLTTRPGTRELPFHNPARPTPAAVAHDEATKDAFATTEAVDGLAVATMSPYSILIDVPVLLTLSAGDELFCAPVPIATDCSSAEAMRQQEAPFFAQQAQLETYLLPGNYGHAFNYAPNADEFHRTVAGWANRMVGR